MALTQQQKQAATVAGVGGLAALALILGSRGPAAGTAAAGLACDTFNRPDQPGWGIGSDGQAWAGDAGLAVTNDEGVVSNVTAPVTPLYGTQTITDGAGIVRFSLLTGPDQTGVILRYQDSSDYWLCRVTGSNVLELGVLSGGTWTSLAIGAFTPLPGIFYWLDFSLVGQQAAAYVWADGDPQPTTPLLTVTSALVPGPGQFGLYGYDDGSGGVSFDSFSVVAA